LLGIDGRSVSALGLCLGGREASVARKRGLGLCLGGGEATVARSAVTVTATATATPPPIVSSHPHPLRRPAHTPQNFPPPEASDRPLAPTVLSPPGATGEPPKGASARRNHGEADAGVGRKTSGRTR
ncbi:MAG: hypothetical protein KC586_29465, partial [Myxococcales bacterium]|nr:hypothetical protein [Myxococcales bacterium]